MYSTGDFGSNPFLTYLLFLGVAGPVKTVLEIFGLRVMRRKGIMLCSFIAGSGLMATVTLKPYVGKELKFVEMTRIRKICNVWTNLNANSTTLISNYWKKVLPSAQFNLSNISLIPYKLRKVACRHANDKFFQPYQIQLSFSLLALLQSVSLIYTGLLQPRFALNQCQLLSVSKWPVISIQSVALVARFHLTYPSGRTVKS